MYIEHIPPPKLNVVMATYPAQHQFLCQAIGAILNRQDFHSLQLIVVSTPDDTEDHVESVLRQFRDPRLLYYVADFASITHQKNIGFYANDSDWFLLMDSDDVMLDNSLGKFMADAERLGADVLYPDFIKTDAELGSPEPVACPEFDAGLLKKRCYITDCSLIRRDVLELYWPMRFEDGKARIWQIYQRMARDGRKIVHWPQPLFKYRQWGGNVHYRGSQNDFLPEDDCISYWSLTGNLDRFQVG